MGVGRGKVGVKNLYFETLNLKASKYFVETNSMAGFLLKLIQWPDSGKVVNICYLLNLLPVKSRAQHLRDTCTLMMSP